MTTKPNGPPDDQGVAWFRTCYQQGYPDLLRFVERRAHPSQAEDVVAEVFLVAWRRLPDLPRDLDGARAWLFGIAHLILANARRGEERRQALAVRIAEVTTAHDPGADPALGASQLDLVTAWRRLRAVHQEALALTAWEGLTSRQAAAVLDISPTAFRLRLSRARCALRAHSAYNTSPAATALAQPKPEGIQS